MFLLYTAFWLFTFWVFYWTIVFIKHFIKVNYITLANIFLVLAGLYALDYLIII